MIHIKWTLHQGDIHIPQPLQNDGQMLIGMSRRTNGGRVMKTSFVGSIRTSEFIALFISSSVGLAAEDDI